MTSAKLMPQARTSMRTSPGPGDGSGRSWTCRTEGSPWRVMTTARTPPRTLPAAEVQAERGRRAGGQPGERADRPALLLEALPAQRGRARHGPAEPRQRLVGDACRRRLDEGQARRLVALVEDERGQDPPGEVRGADAVAGEARGVEAARPERAEPRHMVGRDVDRAAPRVGEPPAAQRGEGRDRAPHDAGRDVPVDLHAAVQARPPR